MTNFHFTLTNFYFTQKRSADTLTEVAAQYLEFYKLADDGMDCDDLIDFAKDCDQGVKEVAKEFSDYTQLTVKELVDAFHVYITDPVKNTDEVREFIHEAMYTIDEFAEQSVESLEWASNEYKQIQAELEVERSAEG